MQKFLILVTTAAMLAGAAAGAQETAPPGPGAPPGIGIDRVVAVVGDSVILQSDVEQELQQQLLALRQAGHAVQDSATVQKMAHDILEQMVSVELLLQEAQRQKLDVTDDEVSSTVDRNVQTVRARFSSDSEYRAQLAMAGFGSPTEFRRFQTETAKRQLLQQKLFQKLQGDGKLTPLPVSQAEVDSAFKQLKATNQLPPLPATVTFRQIVIAPQPSPKEDSVALLKADSLLTEIQHGGDFAQIAKRESMDASSKEQGGDLGWQRRGTGLLPLFERVIFSIPPGKVSPVFRTSLGYHIVKVERAQPAEVKVRQILIRPSIDSADIARAKSLADSVAKLWRAGASYDTLVAKYHDPVESRIIPNPFPRSQLPQTYQDAFAGAKVNEITDPFQIPDKSRGAPKFVVAQLTSVEDKHDPTLADYQEKIRAQLGQEKAFEKYIDGLRQTTFVSIRL
ncbi:MAG TPA: peptidylprolyl isomerase [Gemmatimonadaceae bacterium]